MLGLGLLFLIFPLQQFTFSLFDLVVHYTVFAMTAKIEMISTKWKAVEKACLFSFSDCFSAQNCFDIVALKYFMSQGCCLKYFLIWSSSYTQQKNPIRLRSVLFITLRNCTASFSISKYDFLLKLWLLIAFGKYSSCLVL